MNIEDIKFVSEIAKDAATAVGIIIGGSWALWKWQFSETLRRKHDEVSIEGNIIVSVHPFSNNKNLVSLVSVWKNMTKTV